MGCKLTGSPGDTKNTRTPTSTSGSNRKLPALKGVKAKLVEYKFNRKRRQLCERFFPLRLEWGEGQGEVSKLIQPRMNTDEIQFSVKSALACPLRLSRQPFHQKILVGAEFFPLRGHVDRSRLRINGRKTIVGDTEVKFLHHALIRPNGEIDGHGVE
jgi:hypothetical protein